MLIGYAYEEQWYSFIGKQHFNYNHKSTSIFCSFLWQQAIPFDSVQLFLSDYLKKIFETLPSASNDWRTCLSELLTFRGVNLWRPWPWVFRPVSLVINFSFVFIIYFVVALWIVLFRVPLWHWKLKICIHCFMSSFCHGNLILCTSFQK